MYRHLAGAFVVALCPLTPMIHAADPPPLKREFRAVWVATVANIDWPSKPGLPVAKQQAELIAILDKAKELNLNAVVFQVRPMADALYESKLEPWSEYLTGAIGKAPEPRWDPLEFAVTEAHARGLELHAWFNPYRARHPTAKSPSPADHITRSRPDLAKPYGTHFWMNPTNSTVQDRSLAVVLDVVKRYDVDGVHIDDYFYPYKEKDKSGAIIPFPDDDTWQEYEQSGGKLDRDDWRRDAVNRFIERMYTEVKSTKRSVKVGISPFGIWKPGHPPGIEGLNQYEQLYADAKLWLNQGWIDYYTPQLYWPIAQEKQSFPKLLDWWAGENTKQRHLWPGLYTSRVTDDPKSWPAKEIADQIAITRERSELPGVVHFSMKALMRNAGGVADVLKEVYSEPALVPKMLWLAEGDAPVKPQVSRDRHQDSAIVRIQAQPQTRFVVTWIHENDRWRLIVLAPDQDGIASIQVGSEMKAIRAASVDRAGRISEFTKFIR